MMTKRSVFLVAANLALPGLLQPAGADELHTIKRQISILKKRNAALAQRIDGLEKRRPTPLSSADRPAPPAFLASVPATPFGALADDGPITWRGITMFGVLDAGVAWQSHGVPLNGAFPQGLEYAVSKNSNHAGFHLAPGGMGYSGVGLKGVEGIAPGLSAVFAAYTNFDPLSGQLSNGPASLVQNNGVPLASQSANGDSRAAGQAFNDYAYLGLSSQQLGELTFGRQRTLTTNDRSNYDPIAGSLAFSLLGYSSALSSGDSENARFDDALKYRIGLGPMRFAAIYKFAAPDAGGSATHYPTYQLSAGFDYAALSFDAVYSHISGAVSLSSLSAAQVLLYPPNTLAATISDNQAVLLSVKYTIDGFKFFAGYEYYAFSDPRDPIVAPFVDYNGYAVSVATNNVYEYHDKIQQLVWTGLKYAYNTRVNLSAGYYHVWQNSYGAVHCDYARNNAVVKNAATCAGAEDAIGAVAEYHFNRRFELYAGLMYSAVSGGMANGFLYRNSVDPMVGLRYAF